MPSLIVAAVWLMIATVWSNALTESNNRDRDALRKTIFQHRDKKQMKVRERDHGAIKTKAAGHNRAEEGNHANLAKDESSDIVNVKVTYDEISENIGSEKSLRAKWQRKQTQDHDDDNIDPNSNEIKIDDSNELPEWIHVGDRRMSSNEWKSFSSLLSCWTSRKGNWIYKPQVPPLILKLSSNENALTTKVYSSCVSFKNRELALQYVWEPPATCPAIPVFSLRGFCEVIRGRALLIIGDSTSLNTYETLVNALGSRTQFGEGTCFEGKSGVPFGCMRRQAYTSCSNFNLTNFEVIYISIPSITDFSSSKNSLLSLHEGNAYGSIVVANWGVHSVHDDIMITRMASIMHWFDTEIPSSLFIYRSPNMIHLNCDNYTLPDNTMFKAANLTGDLQWHNKGFLRQGYYWKEYLKNVNRLGRVYLNIFPLSSKRPDQHIGGNDCLHYCIPGPVDTWVILIYATLFEIERRSSVISSDVISDLLSVNNISHLLPLPSSTTSTSDSAKPRNVDEAPLTFRNPLLDRFSSFIISVTSENRCYQYPRCILFGCCDATLVRHVQDYFTSQSESKYREYACMFASDPKNFCKYDLPLRNRMAGHPLLNITITHQMLYDGLANLPPTPPAVYERLQARSHFRVIYMTQGQTRTSISRWYRGFTDLLFLSYQFQNESDLYFPKSNLCAGRLTLYLASRLLELRQGWVYNYFIVMDDDAELLEVDTVNMPTLQQLKFELDLMLWQPAIGAPQYGSYVSSEVVRALTHVDFIMMAYHREAVEILHLWILDFDLECIWSSQLMQSFENAIVYRNHQLVFDLKIKNTLHHSYKKNCMLQSGFPSVFSSHYNATPTSLKHCVPRIVNGEGFAKQFVRFYSQGNPGGAPRPKLQMYHLMSSANRHYYDKNQGECTGWSPGSSHCCTIDLSVPNVASFDSLNNKVVFTAASRLKNLYYYIWHGKSYLIHGTQMYERMGFKSIDLVEMSPEDFKLIEPSSPMNLDLRYEGLPDGFVFKSRNSSHGMYTFYQVDGKYVKMLNASVSKFLDESSKKGNRHPFEIPSHYMHFFRILK